MRLTREVRMALTDSPASAGGAQNGWGGWPAAHRLAPFAVVRLTVEGPVVPQTGYILNIKTLDALAREHALGVLVRAVASARPMERAALETWDALRAAAPADPALVEMELFVTPTLRIAVMADTAPEVTVTQAFEFAAAHRLYSPALSASENAELFGKCCNPNGHGHNYIVEVSVSGRPDPATGVLLPIGRFEAVVAEQVIGRFDHKHLNLDCPEFADLNPSVEHITQAVWRLLEGQFSPARLARVRVWETAKTYAEAVSPA